MISTKDLVLKNKEFNGNIRTESSLKFAESQTNITVGKDKQMAVWLRAIIVDHSFTDGNKRTALWLVNQYKEVPDQRMLARIIIKISKESVTDLNKIVEMINNATRKKFG